MAGETVAHVLVSNNSAYVKGDVVLARTGWRTHALSDGTGLRKLDPAVAPITTGLGVLGMPGFTGYGGLRAIGKPQPGETVVVAAASGPVGSLVGQLAARGRESRRHRRRSAEMRLREGRASLRRRGRSSRRRFSGATGHGMSAGHRRLLRERRRSHLGSRAAVAQRFCARSGRRAHCAVQRRPNGRRYGSAPRGHAADSLEEANHTRLHLLRLRGRTPCRLPARGVRASPRVAFATARTSSTVSKTRQALSSECWRGATSES
jgi:hypothetical protein